MSNFYDWDLSKHPDWQKPVQQKLLTDELAQRHYAMIKTLFIIVSFLIVFSLLAWSRRHLDDWWAA